MLYCKIGQTALLTFLAFILGKHVALSVTVLVCGTLLIWTDELHAWLSDGDWPTWKLVLFFLALLVLAVFWGYCNHWAGNPFGLS